jgi:hypothetical protein
MVCLSNHEPFGIASQQQKCRHARAKTRASIAPQHRYPLTKPRIAERWIAGSSPAMTILIG